MPTPHPLATFAQHMVREPNVGRLSVRETAPRRRSIRAARTHRPWWSRLFRPDAAAQATTTAAPAAAPEPAVAPPGLALPPTLVLPGQLAARDS